MQVLVAGSVPKGATDQERSWYVEVCRDIGMAIAQKAWKLSVGTDRDDTADRLVVDGAAQSGFPIDIEVPYRAGEAPAFRKLALASNPSIHFDWPERRGTWLDGRAPQIYNSHIVLLIGGGDKTAGLYILAPYLSRPSLPLPCLGGASDEQWHAFSGEARKLGLDPDKLRGKICPWQGAASADAVLTFAEELVESMRRTPARQIIPLVSVASVLAVAGWSVTFFILSSSLAAILGILATSAVMGTSLRLFLDIMGGYPLPDRGKILARAAAGILLALALFWLLSIGDFAVNGNVEFLNDLALKSNFWRVASVVSLSSLAAGWLTEIVSEAVKDRLKRLFRREHGT